MSSHNLVNAIVAGDAIEIENAFNSAMTEKISARLDDYRQEIAQSMFTKESIEIDERVNKNSVELAKEEFAEILASEEFAKLDELSKTTLGSYVKKQQAG